MQLFARFLNMAMSRQLIHTTADNALVPNDGDSAVNDDLNLPPCSDLRRILISVRKAVLMQYLDSISCNFRSIDRSGADNAPVAADAKSRANIENEGTISVLASVCGRAATVVVFVHTSRNEASFKSFGFGRVAKSGDDVHQLTVVCLEKLEARLRNVNVFIQRSDPLVVRTVDQVAQDA